MEKYEVKAKDRENLTYGIWNNDMVAWQYIDEWNGNETLSLEDANSHCKKLNTVNRLKKINSSPASFGGLGMGTF